MVKARPTTISEHIVHLEAWLSRARADRDAARAYDRKDQMHEAQVLVDLLETQLDLRRRQRLP